MSESFMKEKPVLPLILSMSLPMVISMLVNSLYNIVDSFFVAKISEDAMTALSLVFPVQNFINAVSIGFGVGLNAVIAYHLGAGEKEQADRAATLGLMLSGVHSVILLIGSMVIMPAFLRSFTDSAAVIDMGLEYSYIAFAFAPVIVITLAYEKFFQAVGRMKATMFTMMSGCVANIILDPLLIFGPGLFPEMGIKGAALATGLGQALTLAVYLVIFVRRPTGLKISRKYLRPEKSMILRLYSIGIPALSLIHI